MNIQKVKPGIRTNLVTGFLGAGKTTCILQLLTQKPDRERWAILVNEFGETGIDGGILQDAAQSEVFIKEIAGGCICCTMGLPMQIALNQLLARSKPDRLIIELSGLGHAHDLLKLLSQPWYKELLQLKATIMLLDGRKSALERCHNAPLFHTQLESADILLINKTDLSASTDRAFVSEYLHTHADHVVDTHYCRQGMMPLEWLDKPCKLSPSPVRQLGNNGQAASGADLESPEIPECGYLQTSKYADGFYTAGWRFAGHSIFDYNTIFGLLSGMQVSRVKAIMNTDRGCVVFNMVDDCLTTQSGTKSLSESRLELIDKDYIEAAQIHDLLAAALLVNNKAHTRGQSQSSLDKFPPRN
ncbi:MAG: GTP-binding protein [Moraxellaceae bacterium]|nr:GTP-binding protein [Moraxellaceae bacterium]